MLNDCILRLSLSLSLSCCAVAAAHAQSVVRTDMPDGMAQYTLAEREADLSEMPLLLGRYAGIKLGADQTRLGQAQTQSTPYFIEMYVMQPDWLHFEPQDTLQLRIDHGPMVEFTGTGSAGHRDTLKRSKIEITRWFMDQDTLKRLALARNVEFQANASEGVIYGDFTEATLHDAGKLLALAPQLLQRYTPAATASITIPASTPSSP